MGVLAPDSAQARPSNQSPSTLGISVGASGVNKNQVFLRTFYFSQKIHLKINHQGQGRSPNMF